MFWDEFLVRLYGTFTDVTGHLPQGLAAAQRIVDLAYDRRVLDPGSLSNRSIRILLVLDSPGVGPVARAEAARRGLSRPAGVPGVPPPATPQLKPFLSHLYLDDPDTRGTNEYFLMLWANGAFARLGPDTVGTYSSYLYTLLLAPPASLTYPNLASPMPPEDFPEMMPAFLPPGLLRWPDERRFLDLCLWLPGWPHRISMYLSFYAQFGLRDIHAVENAVTNVTTYGQTMNELERSYDFVVGSW